MSTTLDEHVSSKATSLARRHSKRKRDIPEQPAVSSVKKQRQMDADGSSTPHKYEKKHFPLELLYEILSYLQPQELMDVTALIPKIAAVTNHPSSSFIWRQARCNALFLGEHRTLPKPPPCPTDLTEHEYTRLLFGETCYYCNHYRPDHGQNYGAVWSLRVRICTGSCLKQHFMRWDSKVAIIPQKLVSHIPTVTCHSPKGSQTTWLAKAFVQKWSQTALATKSDEWLEAVVEERKEISKHAADCASWFYSLATAKKSFESNLLDRLTRRTASLDPIWKTWDTKSPFGVGMSFGDLIKHPAVQKILKKDTESPDDSSDSQETVTSVQRLYPSIVAEWRMNVRHRLAQLVPKDLSEHFGIRCIALASVLFKCSDCKDLMWYHDAFAHDCFLGEADASALGKTDSQKDVQKMGWGSRDNIEYSLLARRPLSKLLQMLKSDAKMNTVFSPTLDKLDLLFEPTSLPGRRCKWRTVILETAKKIDSDKSLSFTQLDYKLIRPTDKVNEKRDRTLTITTPSNNRRCRSASGERITRSSARLRTIKTKSLCPILPQSSNESSLPLGEVGNQLLNP